MSPQPSHRRQRSRSSVLAQGQSSLWLTGSAMTVALLMIVGLLGLVVILGGQTFWPRAVIEVQTLKGETHLGEVTREETYRPSAGADPVRRRQLRTGNYQEMGFSYRWVSDPEIVAEPHPEWAVVLERKTWGRLYGTPHQFLIRPESSGSGPPSEFAVVADGPASAWQKFEEHHSEIRNRFKRYKSVKKEIASIDRRLATAGMAVKKAELRQGKTSAEAHEARLAAEQLEADVQPEKAALQQTLRDLDRENDRYRLVMRISNGRLVQVPLDAVVRGYPANQLSWANKLGVYFSRWGEFLSGDPRDANMEGGVLPAIWGTVTMTLLMSLAVVPFGVLAALYLREYAKSGPVISMVRIAINNLAGVPSIVYGIFGYGFFCLLIGQRVDQLFYPEYLAENKQVFSTGGVLWASLTLALLTLPVVIVATEEALAAVPNSMREGSYACGASKWQTIWRIVLPRAMPGILTGMILAMARGAGEVAPLMIVGGMKEAVALPVDTEPPFVHPSRSFMHLGFHIYDVGFQSRDTEAARPMVYTTTLLLITIVAMLNITAMWLRSRLRRRFGTSQF